MIYDPTRENALAHETVNETVMKEFTVIPMSFGTLFRTEDDVTEFLKHTSDALRPRELEVLELVATGSSNKETAGKLFITENTVKYHMKRILEKLQLENRAQVIAWAARHMPPLRL